MKCGLTHADDYAVQPYVAALEQAGVEAVPISPGRPRALDGLDGLVLCGGADVNPLLYGEARGLETEAPEDALDALELSLLRDALARDLPMLAICRGMQLMNVALGGSLHQHIPNHAKRDTPKAQPVHRVEVVPGSRLARIASELQVNSRHHQSVNRLGDGLVIAARAEDRVVEGIELPGHRFVVGVQWHPEDQAAMDPLQAELFSSFRLAVADRNVQSG